MVLRGLVVLAILLSCLLASHHSRLPRSLLGRCFLWWHGDVCSADNIEPLLTRVVIRYFFGE